MEAIGTDCFKTSTYVADYNYYNYNNTSKKNFRKLKKEYTDCIKRKWRQDWVPHVVLCLAKGWLTISNQVHVYNYYKVHIIYIPCLFTMLISVNNFNLITFTIDVILL